MSTRWWQKSRWQKQRELEKTTFMHDCMYSFVPHRNNGLETASKLCIYYCILHVSLLFKYTTTLPSCLPCIWQHLIRIFFRMKFWKVRKSTSIWGEVWRVEVISYHDFKSVEAVHIWLPLLDMVFSAVAIWRVGNKNDNWRQKKSWAICGSIRKWSEIRNSGWKNQHKRLMRWLRAEATYGEKVY